MLNQNIIVSLASPDLAKGLYLRALCDGMDEALEPFRNEIVELEDVILNNAYTPLSQIFCRIQKHNSLFAILNSIIREASVICLNLNKTSFTITILLYQVIDVYCRSQRKNCTAVRFCKVFTGTWTQELLK